ncbi:MAG: DUF3006 domain-containing protein [Gemmatimonadota bacterium]|nr:DUF3006 domain-containing protein [Gemmatimonadota bacterium]
MTDPTQHLWTIDSIEEGIARIEEDGERIIRIPRYLLPSGAREGQILRVTSNPAKGKTELTIEIDEAATAVALAKSKAQSAATMAASKKRDPGGDVAL